MNELSPIIGRWKTSGKTIDEKDIKGTDIYEWMDGFKFIIHTVDILIGDERLKSMEIIGQGEHENEFTSYSFDNNGSVNIAVMHIKNNRITIVSERERFKGEIRAKGNIIEGKWEHSNDTDWKFLMDIRLYKQVR
ncbi:hypothetical protein QWY86_19465 [Pedobacter aquatilis]|uniref:hypothetical protein n=1 Tax=Pedobacter aquatilis TaxID=351343 RepID=UPI0025B5ED3A|nr:hypothetical protein [Pedobacter aquatilis]MDN3588866.1 hypothetical protein [Pedobacter aquatilis]